MKVSRCIATKSDGTPCRAFPLHGCRLCRHHKKLDQRARRRMRALRPHTIRLGPLVDRPAIQRAIYRVLLAINHGSMPLNRCSALLRNLQTASSNLPR